MAISSIVNCSRFYALPKIHKPTLAFLFIICTASYKLALFLSHSLTYLTVTFTLWKILMTLWINLNVSLFQIVLSFLLMCSFLINVPIQGTLDYMGKRNCMKFIILLLNWKKLWIQSVCMPGKHPLFSMVFSIPTLKAWKWQVRSHFCFVT